MQERAGPRARCESAASRSAQAGGPILTVTPNPAIDISASTQTITPEHKLRCAQMRRDPGGGGVNVARVLTRLGARCSALYPAGPILGRLLHELLEREGVPSVALQIGEETRESFTVLERASGREYRFVLPGPRLEPDEWQACIDFAGGCAGPLDYVVGSGSLPEGVPQDFFARLAHAARQRGARMVLDTSGPPLAAALEEGVYLIKPKLRELRELTGETLEAEDDWANAAQALVRAGRAELVALSLGHHGALLAAHGQTLRASALQVQIASTVGAGDSFVAAMLWRLASGGSLGEALAHGVAGGTAALLAPGTRLAFEQDILRLAPRVELRSLPVC